MMGQVISMDSVSRASLPSSDDEAQHKGFKRALHALEVLKCCSMRETMCAIENWVAAGMLSEAEADALFQWHGWRRGS